MNLKTQGIVIKRMNFGESDKILTIFTERFGKIKAISRGVRKIKSHMAGSLEPFMLIDLELYEGKTFYTICGASIIKEYCNLHSDLKKISEAYYVAELIDRFMEENQRSINTFSLLDQTLSCLNDGENNLALKAYCLKLLEAAGFMPELINCVHCKNKIVENEVYWDEIEGGVICGKCQTTFQHGKKVSDSLIKLLRFFEGNSFLRINCLKFSDSLEKEADSVLSAYIQNILEKELKSKKFMTSLA